MEGPTTSGSRVGGIVTPKDDGGVLAKLGVPAIQRGPIPEDVCDILANRRRRLVVQHLRHHSKETSVPALAEYVAAIELGKPAKEVTYDERKRVRNSLYQHHLPKMADYGFISYDRRHGTVATNERTPPLFRCLDHLSGTKPSGTLIYVALVVVGILFLEVALLGASHLTAGYGQLWVVTFVISATLLGFFHLNRTGDGPP